MKLFRLKTAKIVGSTDEAAWSQTHIFFPEDKEKRKEFGNLLVSFSLKAKKEGLDIVSFGKEIISRFHELYFSSGQEEILMRLKTAINNLLIEFGEQIEIQIAAAVIIQRQSSIAAFFGLSGQGKIVIFRNSKPVILLEEKKEEVGAMSGFIQNNDIFILATSQFYKIISFDNLEKALINNDPEQTVEILAPLVQAEKNNSQTAAVVFKIQIQEDDSASSEAESSAGAKVEDDQTKEEKKKNLIIAKTFLIAANLPVLIKKFIQDFKSQPNVFIKDKGRKNRAKKTTLTVAVVLIGLLLISVFLGSKRKATLFQSKQAEQAKEEAEYKYQQALSMVELNPMRSRTLLTEAGTLLKETVEQLKDQKEKKELEELLLKIEAELEKTAKEYKLETAEIFLDLTLAKEDFKGRDWDFSEGVLQILDSEKAVILEVGAVDKSVKISAGGERIKGAKQVGFSGSRIYALTEQKLIAVDREKGEAIDEKEGKEWGDIADICGFSANAYLLDRIQGKILKYPAADKGIGAAVNYLKAESLDLEDAVSMAIDGSVWLLFSDGTIVKFTRGVKDPFSISGIEAGFNDPEKIYTNADLDHLYILERKNTRIVVIDKKTGEYRAQYVWPGLAGVYDLYASEEEAKILLLTGERIYEISLKPN